MLNGSRHHVCDQVRGPKVQGTNESIKSTLEGTEENFGHVLVKASLAGRLTRLGRSRTEHRSEHRSGCWNERLLYIPYNYPRIMELFNQRNNAMEQSRINRLESLLPMPLFLPTLEPWTIIQSRDLPIFRN